MISEKDLILFEVVDTPEQVMDEILMFYKDRDMRPTHEEMDKLLHL